MNSSSLKYVGQSVSVHFAESQLAESHLAENQFAENRFAETQFAESISMTKAKLVVCAFCELSFC